MPTWRSSTQVRAAHAGFTVKDIVAAAPARSLVQDAPPIMADP